MGMRFGAVEFLEWGAGVVLHEDHGVAAFVAGGYLEACGFGLDVQGHDHAWLCFSD